MVKTRAAALKLAAATAQDQPEKHAKSKAAEDNDIDKPQIEIKVGFDTEPDVAEEKARESTGGKTNNKKVTPKPAKKRGTKRAAKNGESLAKSAKRTRKGEAPQVRGGWDVLPHGMGVLSANKGPGDVITVEANGASSELISPLSDVTTTVLSSDTGVVIKYSPSTCPEEIPTEELLSMANATRQKKIEGKFAILFGRSPYPQWIWPTAEACEEVHTLLTELHGEVKAPTSMPPPSLTVAGCGEVPSVLDALLRTVLSAATTMKGANQSIAALAEEYGVAKSGPGKGSIDWKKVSKASVDEIGVTIGKAGLGNLKAKHLKGILDAVMQNHKKLSLDHLHGQTAELAMKELGSLPGVGVKTAACVILFCLQIPCFAVDTHVYRFCKWLRWVPSTANEDRAFWHCDFHMPAHLKYGLHQLLIRHGQTCERCRADTVAGTESYNNATCPLEHLLVRNKKEAKPPASKPKKKAKGEEEEEDDLVKEEEIEAGEKGDTQVTIVETQESAEENTEENTE